MRRDSNQRRLLMKRAFTYGCGTVTSLGIGGSMILHTGWEQGGPTGALAHLASPSSSDLSMLAYVTVSMTVLWGVILAPMLDIGMSKGITPTLPEGLDKGAVRRVVTALHRAGTTGLSSDERMSVARDLRMASDVLTAMLQRPAWVAAEEAEEHVDLDRHLSMRAHELQDKGSVLADLVEQKHGALKAMLWPQVGETIPLIASIARDFGFDTFDFAPSDRMLPGQVRGQPTPVPQLAAPTIALADEWLSGSRGSVPELLSIAADSAARQDLDELQRSWKAARLSAPDDEAAQRVDETFGTALSDISRTLSEAISARSAGDERDLLIQGRYIESKHGGTAGDLVAS